MDSVPGGDPFLDALRQWSEEMRQASAVTDRSQARWQAQMAAEQSRFTGALLDLYERGDPVVVATRAGRRYRGRVVSVGSDFCAIDRENRATLVIALAALVAVEVDVPPRAGVASSRELPASEMTLGAWLAHIAAERPRLSFQIAGAQERFAGEIHAVGEDVVTIAVGDEPARTLFVPVDAVEEVSLT